MAWEIPLMPPEFYFSCLENNINNSTHTSCSEVKSVVKNDFTYERKQQPNSISTKYEKLPISKIFSFISCVVDLYFRILYLSEFRGTEKTDSSSGEGCWLFLYCIVCNGSTFYDQQQENKTSLSFLYLVLTSNPYPSSANTATMATSLSALSVFLIS